MTNTTVIQFQEVYPALSPFWNAFANCLIIGLLALGFVCTYKLYFMDNGDMRIVSYVVGIVTVIGLIAYIGVWLGL